MLREGRRPWPRHNKNYGTPLLHAPLSHEDIAITFINHATFLIQLNGLNILTDPVWSDRVSPISWLGSPDIALLGMGAYIPRWFMKPMHMNPHEAVTAHKDLNAKLSIGMHFGTFPLAAEAIEEPIKDLKTALEQENISPLNFITLPEGETKIIRGRL